MLAELRNALAQTIALAIPGIRVVPYKPLKVDIPQSGVHAYVRPSEDTYLEPWETFNPSVWAKVKYDVVVAVADPNPESAQALMDELVDPMSTKANFFAAIYNTPTLGITAFHIDAQPMFQAPVQAAERVDSAGGNVTYWEFIFPVQIIANSLGSS